MDEELSYAKKIKIKEDRLKELLGDAFEITIEYSEATIYAVTTVEKTTFLGRKKSIKQREKVAVIKKLDDDERDRIVIYSKAVYEPLKNSAMRCIS